MRDSRFIELLNLYIDHQLSALEATELELEIKTNPSRRGMYNQYCRMQKACTVLFEQESAHAPSSRLLSSSLIAAERKVTRSAMGGGSVFRLPSFASIALAAAACVAFISLVNRVAVTKSSVMMPAPVAPAAASSLASVDSPLVVSAENVSGAIVAPVRESLFSLTPVRPFGTDDSPSELMLEPAAASPVSYSWMRDVELAPVASLADRITLRATSMSFVPHPSLVRGRSQASVESAAFQFQR